jgi:hypothetical protein
MAKTFKNMPSPVLVISTKPVSERDFFDLSDEPEPAKIPVVASTVDLDFNKTDYAVIPGDTSNASSTDSSGPRVKTSRAKKEVTLVILISQVSLVTVVKTVTLLPRRI